MDYQYYQDFVDCARPLNSHVSICKGDDDDEDEDDDEDDEYLVISSNFKIGYDYWWNLEEPFLLYVSLVYIYLEL